MKQYNNILIVRTDRIGDVILTRPAIHSLREAYPNTKISILVAPLTKDLVNGNEDINNILIDDKNGIHKGLTGFLTLIREIKSANFDLAVIFHTKKRTNALCFLAGIPRRVGYKNNKFGFLLTDKIPDERHLGIRHEAEYCEDVVKYLGCEIRPYQEILPLKEESNLWLEQLLSKHGIPASAKLIAVHSGASCPTKKWPVEKFAELINVLKERDNCHVVLIGAEENILTSELLISKLNTSVLNLTGQTSISQLASLLYRCGLLISNDSGPVHMADALNTPVVSIFTRNQPGINPERWKPRGAQAQTVVVPYNDQISFAKGEVDDPKYLELIQTQDVIEAVDAIFKLC